MAIVFDGPVAPDALTTFVREVPINADLAWLREFPVRFSQDNTVDFAEIVHTNRTARFRTWDGRIHVSERDTGSTKRVKLPPISSSLNMGEYERLQLLFAQTQGSNVSALVNAVYNDAENLVREVQARYEQAWGDVLTDGKLTINENGYQGEADYGLPGANLVAPGTLWTTTATATVFSDIRTWSDVWKAANGNLPFEIRTSLRVQRLMQKNTEVINAVAGSNTGRTYVTLGELNGLLAADGLPQVNATYDSSVDVDGTSTRVIADDRLLIMPVDKGQLGYLASGVTATALELVNSNASDLSFADAPGIAGVIEKAGPPYRQFTFVDACGMPVLSNAKRLLVADVA